MTRSDAAPLAVDPSPAEAAAAALAGAVGSLVEQAVESCELPRKVIAERMGVTEGRLSQIVNGDGNLRVSTLGRLLHATGFAGSVTACARDGDSEITVPRASRRGRGNAAGAGEVAMAPAVADAEEGAEMAAAALCGGVGSLIDQMVDGCGENKGDVAARMGVSPSRLSQLVGGDGNVRVSSLARLAHACGFSLQLTGRDAERGVAITVPRVGRRRRRVHEEAPSEVVDLAAVRKRMGRIAPVAELVQRGYLPAEEPEQPRALATLYGLRTIWQEPTFAAAARRHNVAEQPTAQQNAWLACARVEAQRRPIAEVYSGEALSETAAKLTGAVKDARDLAGLPARFAEAGVSLVYVPGFASGKISGASFVLAGRPVIAVSGRKNRMDMLLFTLLHEAAHVVLGHAVDGPIVDERFGPDGGEVEEAADALASEWALPEWGPVPDEVTPEWIHEEARRRGVHPILVSGRLQYLGLLPWDASPVPWVRVKDCLETW